MNKLMFLMLQAMDAGLAFLHANLTRTNLLNLHSTLLGLNRTSVPTHSHAALLYLFRKKRIWKQNLQHNHTYVIVFNLNNDISQISTQNFFWQIADKQKRVHKDKK